jgi:hypothetical protein
MRIRRDRRRDDRFGPNNWHIPKAVTIGAAPDSDGDDDLARFEIESPDSERKQ